MRARCTQALSWIAIYAAPHIIMLGVAPSIMAGQAAQLDPFSVICHSRDAASSSDRTRGQPDLPPVQCEHCKDYVFEPVETEIKSSNVATIAVRLLHKPDEKPVTDAVIARMRIVMAHDGGAEMDSAFVPLASPEPGVYAFMAPLTMAGSWFLSIAAKVPGEPETVVGMIIFRVTP